MDDSNEYTSYVAAPMSLAPVRAPMSRKRRRKPVAQRTRHAKKRTHAPRMTVRTTTTNNATSNGLPHTRTHHAVDNCTLVAHSKVLTPATYTQPQLRLQSQRPTRTYRADCGTHTLTPRKATATAKHTRTQHDGDHSINNAHTKRSHQAHTKTDCFHSPCKAHTDCTMAVITAPATHTPTAPPHTCTQRDGDHDNNNKAHTEWTASKIDATRR